MAPTSATIARLAKTLETLSRHDRERQIFGADMHKYESTRPTLSEVERLEEQIGTRLPREYRAWLLEVGYGAGPYYGLFSPCQIEAELRYHEAVGSNGDVIDAAGITPSHIAHYQEKVRSAGSYFGLAITADSFRGAIPIGHQGCNGYSHLIVAGPQQGTVFGECCDLIGDPWTAAAAFWPDSFSPDLPARRQPLSFLQWIEDWLGASMASIGK